jgi:dTDP-4-dehydrorhamnose reductase
VRVVLTGVSGQVGAHLKPLLSGHEVLALDRHALDLTQPEAITHALTAFAPDLVINPAAYTAVDKAETERALAFAVNAEAPRAMAQVCQSLNAVLVHFSTDYVFNGVSSRPWREDDSTGPLSVYGESKLAGEHAIAETGCKHLILRTSWVYSRMGRNFLLTMQRLAAERDSLRVVNDQHGTPNWAGALARATVDTVGLGLDRLRAVSGTYHLTASGATTWHGFASAIVAAGERRIPVQPIASAEFPTPAKRPAYTVLDGGAFARTFGIALPTWEAGLAQCLHSPAPG